MTSDTTRVFFTPYTFIHIHDNITISHQSAVPRARPGAPRGIGWAILVAAAVAVPAFRQTARANSVMDQVGVTQLQRLTPALTGAGVTVAQVEASVSRTTLTTAPGAIRHFPQQYYPPRVHNTLPLPSAACFAHAGVPPRGGSAEP